MTLIYFYIYDIVYIYIYVFQLRSWGLRAKATEVAEVRLVLTVAGCVKKKKTSNRWLASLFGMTTTPKVRFQTWLAAAHLAKVL